MENKKLQDINKNVRLLLTKFPKLRSPYLRKQCHVQYWIEFDGLGDFWAEILMKDYPKWVSAETISRAIRSVQKKYPELKPPKDEELKKYQQADLFRKFYKPKYNKKRKSKVV